MEELIAAVAALASVEDSALTFLRGLAPMIAATAGDHAAASKLAADVQSRTAALSAALVANTPAADTSGT